MLGSKFAIPIRELNGSAGDSFLDINPPPPDTDKAARVGPPLTVSLSEGSLQIGRLDVFAFGGPENS